MTKHNAFQRVQETANIEIWRQRVCETFCPLELDFAKSGNIELELDSRDLLKTAISSVGGNEINVYRRKHHIREVTDPYYLVKFQLEGEGLVNQYNRSAILTPGDFVVCTTTDPYELHFKNKYRQAVLSVPHETLLERFPGIDDMIGIKMDSSVAPHSLLSHFVRDLMSQASNMNPSILSRLESNVLDLLATSLYAEAKPQKNDCREKFAGNHIHAIKRLISLNLSNPQLSPEFIAHQANISKRYLHMLFKPEGISVSRYIQKERLEACRKALSAEEFTHMSMTDIALEWGFSDASHFHRCFKSEYSITPRQYRLREIN